MPTFPSSPSSFAFHQPLLWAMLCYFFLIGVIMSDNLKLKAQNSSSCFVMWRLKDLNWWSMASMMQLQKWVWPSLFLISFGWECFTTSTIRYYSTNVCPTRMSRKYILSTDYYGRRSEFASYFVSSRMVLINGKHFILCFLVGHQYLGKSCTSDTCSWKCPQTCLCDRVLNLSFWWVCIWFQFNLLLLPFPALLLD